MKFAAEIVLLADELVLVEDVELLSRGQLFAADHAGEALQVENLVPRPPHQVVGRDTL